MAASAWHPHNSTALFMSNGTVDMDDDQFILYLGSVGSNFADLAVRFPSSLTGEISGTAAIRRSTIGNHTFQIVNQSTTRFDGDDAVVTAIGTTMRIKYMAIVNTTASVVMCSSTVDTGTDEVVVTDTGTFTLQISNVGIFNVIPVQSG